MAMTASLGGRRAIPVAMAARLFAAGRYPCVPGDQASRHPQVLIAAGRIPVAMVASLVTGRRDGCRDGGRDDDWPRWPSGWRPR